LQVFLLISIDRPMRQTHVTPVDLESAVAELSLAIGQLTRRLRSEANHSELSWSQLATLARLNQAGALTTADLARAEQVKPQSMGAIVAELEQDGLVQRRPHPTDGRQVLVALTPAGIDARNQRSLAKQQWLLAAIARLDPDEQQTLIKAAALIKRLGEP